MSRQFWSRNGRRLIEVPRWQRITLLIVKVMALIGGLCVWGTAPPKPSGESTLGLVLILYAAISFAFYPGWTLPCIVLGALGGLASEPSTGSGAPSTELYNFLTRLSAGILIGLVCGVTFERLHNIQVAANDKRDL